MAQNRYLECTFLIPTHGDQGLSDGGLHTASRTEWLKEHLWSLFAGMTVAPGHYEGFYSDPDTGQRVSDKSHKYVVAVPPGQIDELKNLLCDACIVFQQKCIYLSIAGEVEFIEPPD